MTSEFSVSHIITLALILICFGLMVPDLLRGDVEAPLLATHTPLPDGKPLPPGTVTMVNPADDKPAS